MRVAFTAAARRDLNAIIDYIALDNPAAAKKVFRAIAAVTRQLADFPKMGHTGRLPNTREIAVAGLPYIIVYHVANDAVTVIAVFHGARDLVQALAERSKKTRG